MAKRIWGIILFLGLIAVGYQFIMVFTYPLQFSLSRASAPQATAIWAETGARAALICAELLMGMLLVMIIGLWSAPTRRKGPARKRGTERALGPVDFRDSQTSSGSSLLERTKRTGG